MAYNERLAERISEALSHLTMVEEKKMFGGVCYMVNGKMCLGIIGDDMMCRIGSDAYETALERNGCREMDFTGRSMKGYVYVSADGRSAKKDFDYWIGLALEFNKKAKASKKSKNAKQ